jgi:uracil-DNA glycosylase
MCFPGLPFMAQLRATWITDSVLCSARRECGRVPASAWRECRGRFLEPQLSLFPNAVVAALGSKSRDRLGGVPGVIPAVAAAPPGCNHADAKASWQAIADRVRSRRLAGGV